MRGQKAMAALILYLESLPPDRIHDLRRHGQEARARRKRNRSAELRRPREEPS
jgi:hypothetical protein